VQQRAMIFRRKMSANTRNQKDFAEGINSTRARSYSVGVVWAGRDLQVARV
jgi:hypothetical protein